MMFVGIALLAWSLNQMTTWTADIDPISLATVTIVQGFGLGFVFRPCKCCLRHAAAEYAYRRNGLVHSRPQRRQRHRHIGDSFFLTQNTQIMHAQIAER